MKRIITDEMSNYKKAIAATNPCKATRYMEERIVALEILLSLHPALDYADELLAMVKTSLAVHKNDCEWEHSCVCGLDDVEKTQALINEIEGKK